MSQHRTTWWTVTKFKL